MTMGLGQKSYVNVRKHQRNIYVNRPQESCSLFVGEVPFGQNGI